ncbi:MAG: sensor histidine kinase [Desulfitobacteriaceae bacterium]|nr:sensor histidine kinase [Desulfitobacteriaceae bacterium]
MKRWPVKVGARVIGVSLRTKIIGLVVGLLLLLAGAAMFQAEQSISPFLNQQLDTEAISTAKYIADRGPDYIYRGDLFQLYTLVRDIKNSNQDIRYIFLVDPQQNVLVDTFGDALPAGLLGANGVNPSESDHIEVLSTEEGLIRDVAIPISGGKVGTVRIGMSEKGLVQAKTKMLSGLAVTTFAVLFVGIILAFILSRILATPYWRLITATRVVSAGDLSYRVPAWPIKDEGSELTQAFNHMIHKMEQSAQEIEDLCTLRRGLTEKVMQVQEEERRHLARELHDETSQSLASLRLGLKYAEEAQNLEEIKMRLPEVRHVLDEAFDGIRRLVTELRPYVLDDGELGQAITRYAQEFQSRYSMEVDLTLDDVGFELTREVASSLYRIVQEVLTNVACHARASQVSIILNQHSGDISLTIEDDGVGFNVPQVLAERVGQRKYGLFGIQERVMVLGGSSQIESSPGQGTTIYVKIPGEAFKHGQNHGVISR